MPSMSYCRWTNLKTDALSALNYLFEPTDSESETKAKRQFLKSVANALAEIGVNSLDDASDIIDEFIDRTHDSQE